MRHCASRQRLGASSAFTWDPRTRLDISPASGSCFLINRASRRLKSFSQELCSGNGWDLPAPQTLAPDTWPMPAPRPGKQVLRSLGCSEGLSLRTQFSARERGARARHLSPPPANSLCSVWRRVSSSRYLGIAPVNVPPTLALPRHVDMCRRRFRRSGSLAVDLRTPASPLSTSGRSWRTARGVQGAPWRVSQATRQKTSKANHPLPRNGNGSLFNHVVNVCLKHREALIIL